MVTETKFKKTEIGSIPEEWNLMPWGDVFDFLSTATYSRDQLSENEEVSYVHYGDIHTKLKHFLDFEKISLSSISKTKAKNYALIRAGDLIMADASEDYEGVGKSVEVRNIKDKKAISGLHTFLMRDKKRVFIDGFKGYLSSNKLIKTQFDRLATGLKVYGVSKNNLKRVLIPYPNPEEQSAIASVLSDTDALIEQLDKLIAKKKNIKQGAMQELLTGKKRLPGFKSEWEVKRLGEIGDITGAGVDKKIKPDETPVRLVNYLDVYHRNFIYSKHLNHWVTAPNHQIIRCAVKKGDIFFTPSSEMPFDIGNSSVAAEDIPDAAYSYHVIRLRLFEDWDLAFRTYIFKTRFFLSQAETSCEGSGKRYVLSLKIFRERLTIKYPKDKKEQSAIAQVLSDMDSEIEQLEQKRDKYLKLKVGMMQQLLTGKIRLKWNN